MKQLSTNGVFKITFLSFALMLLASLLHLLLKGSITMDNDKIWLTIIGGHFFWLIYLNVLCFVCVCSMQGSTGT